MRCDINISVTWFILECGSVIIYDVFEYDDEVTAVFLTTRRKHPKKSKIIASERTGQKIDSLIWNNREIPLVPRSISVHDEPFGRLWIVRWTHHPVSHILTQVSACLFLRDKTVWMFQTRSCCNLLRSGTSYIITQFVFQFNVIVFMYGIISSFSRWTGL